MLFGGFIFTFFLIGFLVTESFFTHLKIWEKIPLYFLLSILLSTWTVYLLSLFLGFSQKTILLSFLLFLPLSFFCRKPTLPKEHWPALLSAFFVLVIFFLALYPAIFSFYRNYFVLAGPNWQDTAMHLGIIQSISRGNFPPQAPYFSGHPLTYYYFSDFHSAILARLKKSFFPQILILTNPVFSFLFFLSLYAFSFSLTRQRNISLLSAFLGTFNGSFIFLRFFQDILTLPHKNLSSFLKLLTLRGYTMEYRKFFQIVPMADYFLQNRPMMVGLPAFTLSLLFIHKGLAERHLLSLFLASLITATLIKFQFFAFISSLLAFLVIFFLKKEKSGKFIGIFLPLPAISFILFSPKTINSRGFWEILKTNISFGPWNPTRPLFWYPLFYLGNLGFPFLLTLLTSFRRPPFLKKEDHRTLLILAGLLFAIPNLVRLTIYPEDMFKFFYFLTVPCSLISACFLRKVKKRLLLLFLLLSSLTSLLTLFLSFLNKNRGYFQEDLQVGLWIRKNIPTQSVFITSPSVHCPVTQIGGRLRVLSYINWPYSHGFNRGEDNVFNRLKDIREIYQGKRVKEKMKKYNAQYIFYGSREKEEFPGAEERWETLLFLQKIYQDRRNKIYRLLSPPPQQSF